jgi:hypothetical protein
VIGTLRREHREAAREAVRTLAAVHGLSDREARWRTPSAWAKRSWRPAAACA